MRGGPCATVAGFGCVADLDVSESMDDHTQIRQTQRRLTFLPSPFAPDESGDMFETNVSIGNNDERS